MTVEQLTKFRYINELPYQKWEHDCVECEDCSYCFMAIHKPDSHACTRGMPLEQFEKELSDKNNIF